jgi:hypothetical protein
VHLPLGLAFIIPALAIGFAWALWTGRVRTRAWLVIVALQTVLLGAGLLAINTGQREEDRVEAVVSETAIEQHEELAEQFVWAAGITLLVAALVMAIGHPLAARALMVATVAGTAVVAASAIRVGHAGGQLVYAHNAGAAYASAAPGGGAPQPGDQRERQKRERDDDRQ